MKSLRWIGTLSDILAHSMEPILLGTVYVSFENPF